MTLPTTIATSAAIEPVRGVLIAPATRSVSMMPIAVVARPCGCCFEACPRTIGALVGSPWQRAFGVLNCSPCQGGEVLIVAARPRGPKWCWGSTELRGPGLVLRMIGGAGDWHLTDSAASTSTIRECIVWALPRRRRASAAAA